MVRDEKVVPLTALKGDGPTLRSSGGGGTSETGMLTREEHDAKIAAFEARVETRFQAILHEVKQSNAELRGDLKALPGRWALISTIIGTGVAVVGILIAVMNFAGSQFQRGRDIQRDIVEATSSAADAAAQRAVTLERRGNTGPGPNQNPPSGSGS